MNLAKTGFNRRYFFWFFSITPFLLVILAFAFGADAYMVDLIKAYFLTICAPVLGFLLASKANDTNNKFKNNGVNENGSDTKETDV